MSYPEKLLADDERVVEHLHPHWVTLVPATFWFLVICAAGGVGIAFLPTSGAGHLAGIIAILAVGLLLLSWLTLGPFVRWKTTHYVFTTHRVLIRRGVFKHVGRDISLQRINDVGFSQTLFERIVKAGTISIESASEHGQESLTDIPRSDEVQQLINRLIEQDGDRRARQSYGQPYGPGPTQPPQQGAGYRPPQP